MKKKTLASLLSFLVVLNSQGSLSLNAFKIPLARANTYTVTNTADSGAGSLRQAITDANANPGADVIDFSVSGTVTLLSLLPAIAEETDLSALTPTQAGANFVIDASGFAVGLDFNGAHTGSSVEGIGVTGDASTICFRMQGAGTDLALGSIDAEGGIEASGCNEGIYATGTSGLTVVNSTITGNGIGINLSTMSDVTIGGSAGGIINVISGNTAEGITAADTSDLTIIGNYIGLNADGLSDQGNGTYGIEIGANNSTVVIGGDSTDERNVISGNGLAGVFLDSDLTTVEGNYIGTDSGGTVQVSNDAYGIIVESSSNTIGGSSTDRGNLISGNGGAGIIIDASSGPADDNIITSNIIGLSWDGTFIVGNTGSGIEIGGGLTVSNTTIGDSNVGNVISGNGLDGITLLFAPGTSIYANLIGLGLDDSPAGNGGHGINILNGSDNVTIGDENDNDRINVISTNFIGILTEDVSGTTIQNNCIGTDSSCSSNVPLRNLADAIYLFTGTSNSLIGGIGANSQNTIHFTTTFTALNVGTGAGDFNEFGANDFLDLAAGEILTQVIAPSNESIAAPTLTSVIRTSPTTIQVIGTTVANASVDFISDGLWIERGTADGSGDFDETIIDSGDRVTVIATTTGGSSSQTPLIQTVVDDITAPSAPTANVDFEGSVGETVSVTGTGEVGTSVYNNGVDTGSNVDGFGDYSFDVTLLSGINSFSVTLVDGMSNVSAATVVTSTGVEDSDGGTPPSPPASVPGGEDEDDSGESEEEEVEEVETGNIVDPDSQTELDTGVSTGDESSLSGENEEEAQTYPIKTTSPKPSTTVLVEPSVTETVPEVDVRDTVSSSPIYRPELQTEFEDVKYLGEVANEYGIPDKLIDIKLEYLRDEYPIHDPAFLDMDLDGDGLKNGEELIWLTEVGVSDTDNDGVDDLHEIYQEGTNPLSYDTDKDGVSDTLDSQSTVYKNPKQSVSDADLIEYASKNPILDPLGVADSDEDGLTDLFELYIKTDPNVADTDGDGVTDGDEFNHRGTDPNVAGTALQFGKLSLSNIKNGETVTEGRQIYMGQAKPVSKVSVHLIGEDGFLRSMGETVSDQEGHFSFLSEEALKAGEYRFIALEGGIETPSDILPPFSVTVVKNVKEPSDLNLNIEDGSALEQTQPELQLLAAKNHKIVVSWKSSVYSQTLIADMAGQTVAVKPAENLELGEHTVSWYAVDLETNQKSEVSQVAFSVTNPAFIQATATSASTRNIVLGSLAVLASLAALGFYFKKGGAPRA